MPLKQNDQPDQVQMVFETSGLITLNAQQVVLCPLCKCTSRAGVRIAYDPGSKMLGHERCVREFYRARAAVAAA